MGSLATEPFKPRTTKHADRYNPLRSVHWLYRPTAIHPRAKPAIGSQRPHLNHQRHRNTHVYQPNPQTHNPASQIHSITTWTCTEARWHLEENPPPLVTKLALSRQLYTPRVGDTLIHTIRRRHSCCIGLQARSDLNQTRPRRCIPPHPGISRRLVASRIQLHGTMVVQPVPPIRLPHIASHLQPLGIGPGMDTPNTTVFGPYTPLPRRLPRHLPALRNSFRRTKQVQRRLQSDLQRLGIPSQGRKERRLTLHQIPRHRDRYKRNGGTPAPHDKHENATALVNSTLAQHSVTPRSLETTMGFLSFASKVVTASRPFLCRLYDALMQAVRPGMSQTPLVPQPPIMTR